MRCSVPQHTPNGDGSFRLGRRLAKARKVDRRWNGTAQGAQGPVERRMQEFGPIGGLVVGAFGEASADVLTLIQRTALFNAERNGLWRCMGASSLEDGAKVLEKRAIRTLGVEGVRGLARARLANLSHVCSNYRQSGPNHGREKRPTVQYGNFFTKTHGGPITKGLGLVHTSANTVVHTLQVGPPTTLLLASKGQEQVAGFPHRYRRLGEVS